MPFTEYTDQAILNSVFGKTSNFGALASAPTVYVGLSSTTPNPDGTGITEPSTGSYARVATTGSTWNAATLANPAVLTNAGAVTFPTATGNWLSSANLTYAVLFDAATSGNCLGFGALTVPKPVTNGDTPQFAATQISITQA